MVKRSIISRLAALTAAQVRYARKQWAARKLNQSQLARQLGVSQPTISRVIRRKVYRQVS